jgi:hypothetical protein
MSGPRFQEADGAHGQLADQMGVLSEAIFEAEWLGGLEHQLWTLYLEALATGRRPSAESVGAEILRFGGLALALGGLWIWPDDEPEPRWARMGEFERRHQEWQQTRRRLLEE